MIQINVWKILIVLLVALVVLGPDHLPKAAHNLGRLIKKFKKVLNVVHDEIQEVTLEPKKDDGKTKDQL